MSSHESHDYNALDMSVKGEQDKRAKREIANMNERRRMQNINSGFHSLRALLPHKHDGEKLSKAAILQHTSNYIYQLEQEITKLLSQNSELKRALGGTTINTAVNTNTPEWIKRFASEPPDCPSCKRRKFDDNNRHLDLSPLGPGDGGSSTESSSEQDVAEKSSRSRGKHQNGNGGRNGAVDSTEQSLRKQLGLLEKQLEQERKMRRMFEEELGYQNNYHNKSNNNNNNGHHHLHNNNIQSNQLEGRRYSSGSGGHHNNSHHLINIGHLHDPSSGQPMGDEVEVPTESIEIEMHSCPASPPDGSLALSVLPSIITEQVSHSAAANAVYIANQHQHHAHAHSTGGISEPLTAAVAVATAAEMSQKLLLEQQRATAKQNAIALPIDMPFVAASEVVSVGEEEKPIIAAAAAAGGAGENGPQMLAYINPEGKVVFLGPASASTMSQATSNHTVTVIPQQSVALHQQQDSDRGPGIATTTATSTSKGRDLPFEIKEEKDLDEASTAVSSILPSNVRCSVITTAISAPIMSTPQPQAQSQQSTAEDSAASSSQFEPSISKAAASRQNLNTIVEAIRHLEGDHLFNESPNSIII